MESSLEEVVALLNKWKDECAPLLIIGQNSSRWGLRSIHEGGVDWNIALRGKLSQASISQGIICSQSGKVVFEGPSGDISLSMDGCFFSYDESCEGPPFLEPALRFTVVSCLFIYFPSNETFVVYQIREPQVP